MDDYYELVGVDRTASHEAVDREIRDQLRRWQQRTSSADLDRRQEAERRVRQLGEARTTLLDGEKRRTYDRQLTEHRPSYPPPTSAGSDRSTDETAESLRQRRFGRLPEPVPPEDWVEEKAAPDARLEPPGGRLGAPYPG